jgi:hypothetical protein
MNGPEQGRRTVARPRIDVGFLVEQSPNLLLVLIASRLDQTQVGEGSRPESHQQCHRERHADPLSIRFVVKGYNTHYRLAATLDNDPVKL